MGHADVDRGLVSGVGLSATDAAQHHTALSSALASRPRMSITARPRTSITDSSPELAPRTSGTDSSSELELVLFSNCVWLHDLFTNSIHKFKLLDSMYVIAEKDGVDQMPSKKFV